jgi:hypothetical protein
MDKPTMKSNYGLGPKTGNAAREGKRAAFKAGKEERSNLADSINAAYKSRVKAPDAIVHGLENVVEPIKPKKFKR